VIRRKLFILLLFLIFVLPLLVLILTSVSSTWQFPDLVPDSWNARALRYASDELPSILTSLASSLAYALGTVLLAFILCVLPASVFARSRFRFKRILETLLLAPALVPSITFSMGIHYVFIVTGLADTFVGIIMVLTIFSYPYMLRALTAGYIAYGSDYEICAKNLGAGFLMRLWRVELPLLFPSIVSGGTVVFLLAFSEYFLVFLIGGGAVPSFTGYLFPFLNSSDRPLASVLTLIFLVIPIVLFAFIDLTVSRIYRKKGMMD